MGKKAGKCCRKYRQRKACKHCPKKMSHKGTKGAKNCECPNHRDG